MWRVPADNQISQTDQELKCDAWSRDFCLGTVDGIIGTCHSDFLRICPSLTSLGCQSCFTSTQSLGETLATLIPHPVRQWGQLWLSATSANWPLWGAEWQESHWRKEVKTCSAPTITALRMILFFFFFFQMPTSGIGLFSGQLLMPYFQHVYTVARKCIVTSSKIIDKYNVPKLIRWEWAFRFLLKMTIKSLQWEKCRNPWVDGLELLWLIKTTPTI